MGNSVINYFSNRLLLFELLGQAAKNISEMAAQLVHVVNIETYGEREPIFKQINKMENIGDDITHKIYLLLNKLTFAPLNRNNIRALASTLDDIADSIQEASGRMYLYQIEDFLPPIKDISSIILMASLEIETAVNLIKSSKKTAEILEICRKVKTYERQSDQVYYHAVAILFAEEKDPIRLLKYREIFLSLETSVNKCKNVSDTLGTIMINR